MTDQELIAAAARAAGYEVACPFDHHGAVMLVGVQEPWNPLADDGDALRLAVALGFCVITRADFTAEPPLVIVRSPNVDVEQPHGADPAAATRRAIVRAAADTATPNVP